MIHPDAELLLAAGAALDDLEPAERLAYDAHAAACADCRHLEGELEGVLADLALVVPERRPPADLFAGIRLAIDEEAAGPGRRPTAATITSLDAARDSRALRATNATRAAPAAGATRLSRRWAAGATALAAVLALVAVGVGVRMAGLQDDLDRSTAQVAALRAQVSSQGGVVAAAMNPGHVTVALHAEPLAPRANATVVFIPGSASAYLVAEGLPATPADHGYQLWYADDAGVHPLQTVSYDGSGPLVVPLDVDLASSSAVMLTLEASGGAQGDPGPQVVYGEL